VPAAPGFAIGQVDGAAPCGSAAELAAPGVAEDRTAVLPEGDGAGSRSGSAGRDGPGTDGRGLVGFGGGVGTGLVGLGAVLCAGAGEALAGETAASPVPIGALWCGCCGLPEPAGLVGLAGLAGLAGTAGVVGLAVRVEPVGWAGAGVAPPRRSGCEVGWWALVADSGAAGAGVAVMGWASRAAGVPGVLGWSAEDMVSGFAAAAVG
jgi:hypothetical protein